MRNAIDESVGLVYEWKKIWMIGLVLCVVYSKLELRMKFNYEDFYLAELTKGRPDWIRSGADKNTDITALKKPISIANPLRIAELSCYVRLLLQ